MAAPPAVGVTNCGAGMAFPPRRHARQQRETLDQGRERFDPGDPAIAEKSIANRHLRRRARPYGFTAELARLRGRPSL